MTNLINLPYRHIRHTTTRPFKSHSKQNPIHETRPRISHISPQLLRVPDSLKICTKDKDMDAKNRKRHISPQDS